ncbi:hypothetical protein CEQ21_00870 [Niallia circulans]|uniref:Uncharacterized protein n=1 Tax=Niallia circulans TaxID=1397 RepID=A0A553SRE9_NIACI|nr:hypothetical protein [Niallia circulans]TRZ39556.1 hypothetical protein CEQ21_00870 [Niallia circulans]
MKIKKYKKSMALLILLAPWLSAPLLGKASIKRFLPAGIFISFIVHMFNIIAKKRKWWFWYQVLSKQITWVFPFTWGPFLVGSLWILKYTYGKFFSYLVLNLLVDSAFTYLFVSFFKKINIFALSKFKKIQLLSIFMIDTLLLYLFQFFLEKAKGEMEK